ncbi:hypothetical protein BofuT4_uP060450.1 [Botrytis cinerea T4]|uniref:Uncharacterized protein n=1 Tax=Botryotinia fuckeliana (strain T4) TaxID=999810 RepID=G2XU75_BOTF4|nr:hypothetical protein BofuT4_uP060450.1 [Botrytis cinerea T4]
MHLQLGAICHYLIRSLAALSIYLEPNQGITLAKQILFLKFVLPIQPLFAHRKSRQLVI